MTPDLQKGTELAGRYVLVRKLGAGADTQTWLATDRMTRASVALKILASDRLSAESLRAEWQTGIRLMHAHIVRAFEFHSGEDGTFYSMQYVPGSDATALAGAPLAAILPPIALIADALRYAHAKGVVHRDVKASNVLFDNKGVPYLSDFGVAANASTLASGGSTIAQSPQSLAGEPASPADDVFALGGLIYELVAGYSPYSSGAVAEDIRRAPPPDLVAASGEPVPEDVQALLRDMLAKPANARPDAQAVVQRLSQAGFDAALAPAAYFSAAVEQRAEIIAADTGGRRRQGAPAAAVSAPRPGASGVTPRTLGISLAVLLVILVGVVFVLPNTISTPPPAVTEGSESLARPDSGAVPGDAGDPVPARDERVVARSETEAVLGTLLSKMETLERRAVQRWGGLRYKQALDVYAEGDAAYLARDYATASARYRDTIEIIDPLLVEVDRIFATTMASASAALEAADTAEALRLFELAVAISPGNAAAQAGYLRARNLDTVLSLTEQGLVFEKNLELDAAQQSFARAVEIDPAWAPAQEGLQRVNETMQQMQFDLRMTEGLTALADGYYDAARAAFRMAQQLKPGSPEPADGLLQVELAIRLDGIAALEARAAEEEAGEQWEAAVQTYQAILEIDANLEFAQQGQARAEQMTALHQQLDDYIAEPDALSSPTTLQRATNLLVSITRMPVIGKRLSAQRDELSRLLKRAATPVAVQLVSDNLTDVSIYKVGKLGSFATHELSLRPGTYIAVGSRPGYRDVRLEFQVGPELEAKPVVIRCEEAI